MLGRAEHLDRSRVGQQDVHDHPQRRRLARAVGPDEAVDGARRHAEGEAIDGRDAAESLGDVGQADGIAHSVFILWVRQLVKDFTLLEFGPTLFAFDIGCGFPAEQTSRR